MKLAVLRLSHRVMRDKRISTHLALTARAFGADEFFYTGDHDSHVEESIERIQQEWGGDLTVTHIGKPWNFLKEWKKQGGIVIHLTMYGIELSNKLKEIQNFENGDLLITTDNFHSWLGPRTSIRVQIGHLMMSSLVINIFTVSCVILMKHPPQL